MRCTEGAEAAFLAKQVGLSSGEWGASEDHRTRLGNRLSSGLAESCGGPCRMGQTFYRIRLLVTRGRGFYNPPNSLLDTVVCSSVTQCSTAKQNGCIFRERMLEY